MISFHRAFGRGRRTREVAALAALAIYAFVFAQHAAGAGPAVTAVLDNSETAVGQPVHLEIKVTGVTGATPPGEITVDGLDIRYSGQSQLVEGRNFQFSYSFVYTYTVMPLRAGTFQIPPQSVRSGASTAQTPALTLNVADSSVRPSRSNRRSEPADPSKIGFIELILTKSTAYVGEMIPAEVRVGFNARVPVESLGSGIQIAGQGFTTQKFPEPRQGLETRNGKSYAVWTFKTALSAARPGKIEIGPTEMTPVVRIAQSNPRRQALPNDLFDMDDPFFNSFFNDPAFQPSVPREITLKSEAQTIEVKPLPANAPREFSGAIGSFSLRAEAKPTTAQIGDPITVTTTVSGRGNFDRVAAPDFEDDRGWHKYPPNGTFKKDDEVGISGVKTFETVLSANESKQSIPPVTFAFFDPIKAGYITLHSEALPVRVQGGAAPAASASAAPATVASSASAQTSPAAVKQSEILPQLDSSAQNLTTFAAIYARRSFWLVQLLPLLGLIAFGWWIVQRARRADRHAQRIAALQEEFSAVQRRLQQTDSPAEQYLTDASRAVQLKAALQTGIEPAAVDAAAAAAAFRVDEATKVRLDRLFQERDELRYSGNSNGATTITEETRREFRTLIENL
ncbi:MAG TPA: BatD family protein [Chthoniobacterales bacterium]|nr:BatD family protein [Chthoniobacterales bacterium]